MELDIFNSSDQDPEEEERSDLDCLLDPETEEGKALLSLLFFIFTHN